MAATVTHIIDGAEVSDEELALARRYPMTVQWVAEDDVFVATFPDIDGLKAYGKSAAEAAQHGEEVIIIYITSLLDAGRALPEPHTIAASL
jgi:predicted RNase H-like HicB family nuclease